MVQSTGHASCEHFLFTIPLLLIYLNMIFYWWDELFTIFYTVLIWPPKHVSGIMKSANFSHLGLGAVVWAAAIARVYKFNLSLMVLFTKLMANYYTSVVIL